MKHDSKQSAKSKKQLISYYGYKEVDFYIENEIWYLNIKDNVGVSAFDVLRDIKETRLLEIQEE